VEEALNGALIIGYIAFLILAVLAPFLPRSTKASADNRGSFLNLISSVGIAGAVFVLVGRPDVMFPLAPLLLIPLIGRGPNFMIGGAVALALFAPVAWWGLGPLRQPHWQWLLFAVLVLGVGAAVRLSSGTKLIREKDTRARAVPMFLGATLIAMAFGFWTAPFNFDGVGHTAWHHWGAYLSPVDLLLSGGTPFYDFPIQYGIGPTLLLAASCGNDCWNGMFNVVLITNALYFGAMVACASIITANMANAMRLLAFVAMFCAALLWTAFPAEVGATLATPSVAALRFLPIAFQLLFILSCAQKPKQPIYLGHVIWALNSVWSIEAAIFASVLWWPWLALRHYMKADRDGPFMGLLLRYAVIGGAALIASTAAILAVFRLNFGLWPEAATVFAYIQNPPGPLPPNIVGPLGLVVLLVIISLRTLGQRDADGKLMLYACLLAMLAAFSYYLSRSHDNNILNLLPFVLLVALCVLSNRDTDTSHEGAFTKGFITTMIMAIVAFVAIFNFTPWTDVARRGKLLDFGPHVVLRQFAPAASDPEPIIAKDALDLIAYARRNSPSAPILFNEKGVMPHATPGKAWTSVNSIANYSFLPQSLVDRYIKRGAKTYRRSGWLIVQDGEFDQWPSYFAYAYDMKPMLRQGQYVAYFLRPKLPPKTTQQ
jgi:Ca2+/Na+ antiporter